ncbi:MAG TPA: hypothetical protein PKA63_06145 [Oligoflexia bacterium]|nr:hypothetical protein [Oligoflexia bacterium]HMP48231.1 hypothetical protein [Oligoflexia bacterium]
MEYKTGDSGIRSTAEDGFELKVAEEVERTSEFFAESERRLWGNASSSWIVAADIIKKVRPIPWVFWIMIRSVYGYAGQVREVDPMTFTMIEKLIMRACQDQDLVSEEYRDLTPTKLTQALEFIGSDVAASLCFIHSVGKRVSINLSERIFRAIMDDAFLRCRLGVVLGQHSPEAGIGRCLLAGFTGRAGLAVQLASGTEDQAKIALAGLATGKDISKVCVDVYKCDPLQVAALSLVAGGCSKEIALGVAAFSLPSEEVAPGTEQYKWLTLFSILENIRLNRFENISKESWHSVGISTQAQASISKKTQNVFRKGHAFNWLLTPLSEMLDR